jgi:hypothetical protein
MNGLYNMMFGVNRLAGPLLAALNISHRNVPRFRDCFLHVDGTIVIYTRTGGGNRAEYEKENQMMRGHSNYLSDEDDALDSTYALFHFSAPTQEIKDAIPLLLAKGWGVDPPERWRQTMEALKKL